MGWLRGSGAWQVELCSGQECEQPSSKAHLGQLENLNNC